MAITIHYIIIYHFDLKIVIPPNLEWFYFQNSELSNHAQEGLGIFG
jgi:hypothetical protein